MAEELENIHNAHPNIGQAPHDDVSRADSHEDETLGESKENIAKPEEGPGNLIQDTEKAHVMAIVERDFREAARELGQLGLHEKAQEILQRMNLASEIAKLRYELTHPPGIESAQDLIAEGIARLHIEGQKSWYNKIMDIGDDNPDKEQIIQYVFDLLDVDQSKGERLRPIGGFYGGGTNIVGSFEGSRYIGDKYVIHVAWDWPTQQPTPTEIMAPIESGKRIKLQPREEDKFTGIYIGINRGTMADSNMAA